MTTSSSSSSLKERMRADLTAAIKGRDELRMATLRMTLAAVGTEEVAGTVARQLSDDEVLKVLIREVKKRHEAAAAFADAGRAEQADRERSEGEVLKAYLPEQLSEDELRALVADAVAQVGATGIRDMGKVMKVLTPRVAGRADGGRVAAQVKSALG